MAGEPNALVAGAVLGLREQVSGGELRVGRRVCEDEHLAWAGQQVDGHAAKQQSLSRDDVGVAGAEDFLDRADGLGSASHRGDGLRATDTIHLGGSGLAKRGEQGGIDLAVFSAGSAGDDFAATGNLGQGDGHQRGRCEGGCPAGDVHANPCERIELFTDHTALGVAGLPVLPEGSFCE